MKQFLLKSVLFSFIFFGFGIVAFFIIKARSTTNPGLAEQSPIGGLYVNNGDTLNAAKRNKLVDKASRQDMLISDTTTQFNTECERRRKKDDGTLYIAGRVGSNDIRWKDNDTARRNVRSTNKTKFQLYNRVSGTRSYQSNYQTLTKLQYRCP